MRFKINQVIIHFIFVIFKLTFVLSANSIYLTDVLLNNASEFGTIYPAKPLSTIPENCTHVLEVFNQKITELINCTVMNARPVQVCINCGKEYNETRKAYSNMKNESSICKQIYFESDQVGIIDLVFSQAENIWGKNNCQNCYKHYTRAENFFTVSKEFDACIHEANKTSGSTSNNTCEMCHKLFSELNNLYNQFVLDIGTYDIVGVCMDIVDQMNITRHYWATQNCITFDYNIGYPNIITAVLVGAMPVFFYMLSKNISIIEDVKLVRQKIAAKHQVDAREPPSDFDFYVIEFNTKISEGAKSDCHVITYEHSSWPWGVDDVCHYLLLGSALL